MGFNIDAIKIDEVEIENTNEKSSIYVAKVEYKELNKICKLGNVSINREVDDDRAEKMVDYIKKKGSFYPTIVVATTKKNIIDYSDMKKKIEVRIREEQDKFIVLDGQHRFESINLLVKENPNIERYQSVLLIENINDFQQRKIFVDINDTPRKVTTGTKLRFEKTIANYYSLSFVDFRDDVLECILMDDNQTSNNKEIPYKYIVKFNEKLINVLQKNFARGKLTMTEIDQYKESIFQINNMLIEILKFSQNNDNQITRYELFYIVLGEIFSCYMSNSLNTKEELEINKIQDEFTIIKNNLPKISSDFLDDIPKDQSGKKEKIHNLISNVIGRK